MILKKRFQGDKKKSKLFFRIVFVVVGALLAIASFFIVRKILCFSKQSYEKVIYQPVINVVFSECYAEDARKKIQNRVLEIVQGKKLISSELQKIACNIKNEFSLVKHVSWKHRGSRELQIIITGQDPLFCVNENRILSSNGTIFSHNDFQEYDVSTLHTISLEDGISQFTEQQIKFLTSLPTKMLDTFMLHYVSSEKIILKNKSDNRYSILTNEASIRDSKKLQTLAKIYDDMQKKKLISKTRIASGRDKICFDVRFENRVVAKRYAQGRRRRGLR